MFDRNSQGVELTTYGQALLKCGVTVFDEMRQGLKQIEFLTDPDAGELRIGCPEILMAGLLPVINERFSRQYPRVRLHVHHANTGLLQFEELRGRRVELLLGRMPTLFSEDDLNAEVMFEEPYVAVAAARSRWSRRPPTMLAELVGEKWVLPPYDSVAGSQIVEIFRAANLKPPLPGTATLSVQSRRL